MNGAVIAVFLMDAEEAKAVGTAANSGVEDNGGNLELAHELLLDPAEMEKRMQGLHVGHDQNGMRVASDGINRLRNVVGDDAAVLKEGGKLSPEQLSIMPVIFQPPLPKRAEFVLSEPCVQHVSHGQHMRVVAIEFKIGQNCGERALGLQHLRGREDEVVDRIEAGLARGRQARLQVPAKFVKFFSERLHQGRSPCSGAAIQSAEFGRHSAPANARGLLLSPTLQ